MKYIRLILCCGLMALMFVSCDEWLNINTDPENPSSESATYQTRLAHIEAATDHAQQVASWRTSMSMGDWTRYFGGGNYWNLSVWNPLGGICTTPYQWWFVSAACNIQYMYDKAMEAGAYHYMAAARLIRAYGFMLMTDLYGEMPYTESLGESATPAYDTGKTIYLGCLADLDESIELFQKSQEPGTASLAVGDCWNNGDVSKWIKFAYLLKARFCNKLNKKAAGSYLEGKYDAATILACLEKGPQSNNEGTIMYHTDDTDAGVDFAVQKPVKFSPIFSVCGMNAGYMPTKMLYDNLTNFAGYGVEDPRADKILPWAVSTRSDDTPDGIKFSGIWRRTMGVDMTTGNSPLLVHGPLNSMFKTHWYIQTDSPERLGDTIYIQCRSSSKGYNGDTDLFYKARPGNEKSRTSGSFYSRPSSPTYLGTYDEACFIKAEVLFNQGNTAGAFTAYKNGIKASMELMNEKLNAWCAEDPSLEKCPSFTPMTQSEMDNFLANGIGTAGDLTLGKILTQKRIALMFSVEIWNDMRRYDFDTNLFLNWDIPAYHDIDVAGLRAIPVGKQLRRWMHCSHELNYNATNLQAIGEQVPGANMSADAWNKEPDVWTINVWWDSPQE